MGVTVRIRCDCPLGQFGFLSDCREKEKGGGSLWIPARFAYLLVIVITRCFLAKMVGESSRTG